MKAFYNFPYKQSPSDIMANKLNEIYLTSDHKFKYVELKKDKIFYRIFGSSVGSFIVYQSAQLISLIKFRQNSKNWYFDFFFK